MDEINARRLAEMQVKTMHEITEVAKRLLAIVEVLERHQRDIELLKLCVPATAVRKLSELS